MSIPVFIQGEKRQFYVTFTPDLDPSETLTSVNVTGPSDVVITNVGITTQSRTIADITTPAGQGIYFTVDMASATAGRKAIDILADTSLGQKVGWRIRVIVE